LKKETGHEKGDGGETQRNRRPKGNQGRNFGTGPIQTGKGKGRETRMGIEEVKNEGPIVRPKKSRSYQLAPRQRTPQLLLHKKE